MKFGRRVLLTFGVKKRNKYSIISNVNPIIIRPDDSTENDDRWMEKVCDYLLFAPPCTFSKSSQQLPSFAFVNVDVNIRVPELPINYIKDSYFLRLHLSRERPNIMDFLYLAVDIY